MYEIRGTQTVEISHIQRRIAQQHAYFCMQSFLPEKKKCLIAKLDFLLNLKFEELRKIPQKSLAQFLSQEHRKTAFDLKMVVDQPCGDLAQCLKITKNVLYEFSRQNIYFFLFSLKN